MKILLQSICTLFLSVLLVSCFGGKQGVDNTRISNFEIDIEKEDSEIRLICSAGCNWEDLTFDLGTENGTQLIDNEGMTTQAANEADERRPFLVKLVYDDDKISIEGLAGTAFRRVEMGCDEECNARLTERGIEVLSR